MKIKNKNRLVDLLVFAIVASVAIMPLFFSLPFRDNIYLSWEGAYRMFNGQSPFKDFGMPMGYIYWLLPTLSFYLFGPYLFSLVKIQVFINLISGVSFYLIIRRFSSDRGIWVASVLLYVLSFSFYNFWPWYNHTVIVLEFIALAFLLSAINIDSGGLVKKHILVGASAFFCFLSFFTKQDGGAFAILVCGTILFYYVLASKNWTPFLIFVLGLIVTALLFIIPLIEHNFTYWFNVGQAPHSSRIYLRDFLDAIIGGSAMIKFYFLLIVLVLIRKSGDGLSWVFDVKFMVHLLLTLGILFQASILQVTSYVPADGNIYYHSFAFFFVLANTNLNCSFEKPRNFIILSLLIVFWWSGLYWKYANRMFGQLFSFQDKSQSVVSISSYAKNLDTTIMDKSKWDFSKYRAFDRIKLPLETIDGMNKLVDWNDSFKGEPKILNMSELTPLAEVLGYKYESGIPLWYHLNVGMFQREMDLINKRIRLNHYDLVLFEYIPHLNNFYPFEVREVLIENYELLDSFQAPRELTTEVIEVYVRKQEE